MDDPQACARYPHASDPQEPTHSGARRLLGVAGCAPSVCGPVRMRTTAQDQREGPLGGGARTRPRGGGQTGEDRMS